jgi:hypothetical protein
MRQARVRAKERDVKPITIYVTEDGVLKEIAKADEFSVPGIVSDLMKGRHKTVTLKKTAKFKSVSNRDPLEVVK